MDYLLPILDWIKDNIVSLIEIIGAFAIIARWTPNKTDDKIVQGILDTINFLGMNHGKAKNAE